MQKSKQPAAKPAQNPCLKRLLAEAGQLNVVLVETHRQIARESFGTVTTPKTPRLKQMNTDIENP